MRMLHMHLRMYMETHVFTCVQTIRVRIAMHRVLEHTSAVVPVGAPYLRSCLRRVSAPPVPQLFGLLRHAIDGPRNDIILIAAADTLKELFAFGLQVRSPPSHGHSNNDGDRQKDGSHGSDGCAAHVLHQAIL